MKNHRLVRKIPAKTNLHLDRKQLDASAMTEKKTAIVAMFVVADRANATHKLIGRSSSTFGHPSNGQWRWQQQQLHRKKTKAT